MKDKDKKVDKPLTGHKEKDSPTNGKNERKEKQDKDFPGYPHYPASEDIYNREDEVDLNPEDLSKTKKQPENLGKRNEK